MALPTEAGKAPTLPPEVRFAGEITTAVISKLNEETPQSLDELGERKQAQSLRTLFDFLNASNLMGLVDRKVVLIRKERTLAQSTNVDAPSAKQPSFERFGIHDASAGKEPPKPTVPRYKKPRRGGKPRQLYLSQ